jgi:ribonucleoside-triphosphate reductase
MHYPESRFYIRRIRLSVHSELLPALREAGYDIEPDVVAKDDSVVVSFPVDVGEGVRTCVLVLLFAVVLSCVFIAV